MPGGISKQTALKGCVDKCAVTKNCVAVSYATDGTCYLKSVLKQAVYSANLNGMLTSYY